MANIEIADMYNGGKTLEQISVELGVSKRTIQRRLTDSGFKYVRVEKKYIKVSEGKDLEEKNKNNENENVIVNRTFALPQDIAIALKLKATLEGKTVTDLLREILQNSIEPRYFNMK